MYHNTLAQVFASVDKDFADRVEAGGPQWIRSNRRQIREAAGRNHLTMQAARAVVEELGKSDTVSVEEPERIPGDYANARRTVELTIVIPCHNYERYLGECLASIHASDVVPSRVIVVDDASDSPVKGLEAFPGLELHRVEFRSLWKVCQFGFSKVLTRYVMFLDADDVLDRQYIGDAISRLQSDREAAFCFPTLRPFGDVPTSSGPHWTERAPQTIRWQDLEAHNWVPMSTVFRSEVIRQSLALTSEISDGCTLADWRIVRNILRAGPWRGVRSSRSLNYRQHADNDSKTPAAHAVQASLSCETVTIVVAFSGRWSAWWKLRDWIVRNSWPSRQTRLLILNSSHQAISPGDLLLSDWVGAGLQIERIDVGRPGLADEERVNAPETCLQVEAAVSGLYNQALQIIRGEYVLFIEDDVIPQKADSIERMLSHMAPDVAAVTGSYAHRYYPENAVAFDLPYRGLPSLKSLSGPDVEQIGGSGFGCLLARCSVFSRLGLAGDNPNRPHYDCEVSARVADAGLRWILDRTVSCDHLVKRGTKTDAGRGVEHPFRITKGYRDPSNEQRFHTTVMATSTEHAIEVCNRTVSPYGEVLVSVQQMPDDTKFTKGYWVSN